jgi:hypothetical protein
MTKSYEEGENEYTRAAKREALRTGRSLLDILKDMRKTADNSAARRKIKQALKYLVLANKRKRRKQ